MNFMNVSRSLIPLLFIALCTPSCKKTDDVKANPNTKQFYPEIFRQNMVSALGNHPIGYSFTINHKGLLADSASKGFARMSQDGARSHSIMRRMNIASITKYLTAVCAVKVLEEKGIPLNTPIYTYLPTYWKPSEGAKNITFHDLLRHRSGLTTGDIRYATDYWGLKDCIEKPIANPDKGYNYSNVNFALFRIMMAYIHDKPHALNVEAQHMANKDTSMHHTFMILYYMGRMDENVFKPAGVSGAMAMSTDRTEETLSYSATAPSLPGAAAGDWTRKSGGGGYYLSAYELAKILAYINHSDKVLSATQRNLMQENMYGFDGGDSPATAFGQGYGKGGALGYEDNGTEGTQAGDRGLQCVAMKLPGGVEFVLFVNSLGNGYADYTPMIKTAYEGAWK